VRLRNETARNYPKVLDQDAFRERERHMAKKKFTLVATISTERVPQIKVALDHLIRDGSIERSEHGFAITAKMTGENARDLNRAFLSALRKVEKKTRLRAEWISGKTTERFFDYVPKGQGKGEPLETLCPGQRRSTPGTNERKDLSCPEEDLNLHTIAGTRP
jgi:hypothetical protein